MHGAEYDQLFKRSREARITLKSHQRFCNMVLFLHVSHIDYYRTSAHGKATLFDIPLPSFLQVAKSHIRYNQKFWSLSAFIATSA
jgi:hypothetical protein